MNIAIHISDSNLLKDGLFDINNARDNILERYVVLQRHLKVLGHNCHTLDFYDYKNILILGRVTSGRGGEVIIKKANAILKDEFPQIFDEVSLVVPDEKSRRVGQAVAAASLPKI